MINVEKQRKKNDENQEKLNGKINKKQDVKMGKIVRNGQKQERHKKTNCNMLQKCKKPIDS